MTDTWTSPNHCAFVVGTVHLEYKGKMLLFLLDIFELPEVFWIIINHMLNSADTLSVPHRCHDGKSFPSDARMLLSN